MYVCSVAQSVWLFVTAWTVARQAPLSMEFSRQRTLEWVAISYFRGSSPSRDWIRIPCVTCVGRRILYHCATREALVILCTWYLLWIYLQKYLQKEHLLKLYFNNMSTWGLPRWLNGDLPMQETWVRFLDWENPLEKEMATHSTVLCLENSMGRGAWRATVHGISKSRTRLSN